MDQNEYFLIFGAIMLFVTWLIYFRIVWDQYKAATKLPASVRYSALSLRCALIVPFTALTTYIQLLYPFSFVGLLIFNSLVQVVVLYSVLAMLVIYIGGPKKVIQLFSIGVAGTKQSCICWRNNPRAFYKFILFYHDQFIIRPFLFLIAAVFFYRHVHFQKIVGVLFAVSLASIVLVIVGTVQFYFLVWESVQGIGAVSKMVAVCFSTLIISAQSAILEAFYVDSDFKVKDKDFSTFFWFFQMVEMLFFSLIFSVVFTEKMNTLLSNPTLTDENTDGNFGSNFTFVEFMKDIFRFHDMFKPTRLDDKADDEDQEAMQRAENNSIIVNSNSLCIDQSNFDASFLRAAGFSPSIVAINTNTRRNVGGEVL